MHNEYKEHAPGYMYIYMQMMIVRYTTQCAQCRYLHVAQLYTACVQVGPGKVTHCTGRGAMALTMVHVWT